MRTEGLTADDAAALRAKVERAVTKELERVGPAAFEARQVLQRFMGKGASQATLYRWTKAIIASGKPAEHLKGKVKAAAKRRAKRTADPASEAAREVVKALPAPLDVAAAIAPAAPETGVPFLDELKGCLARGHKMVDHSLAEDGKLRNAKVFLQGSEHIRRTIETIARVQDGLLQTNQIKRYHQVMFDALRRESPEVVERILIQLRQLNLAWSVG
jgi:hypothetical protein